MTSTALVTGASSGIGKATAELFVRQGYRVFGTSRSSRPDVAGIEMLELDVRSDESVRGCVEQLLARAEQVDVLVNNAGSMHLGMAEETTLEEARTLFETNLFGVIRMTNAVLPGMRAHRRGRIINVGSAAAWVGEPGEGVYAASKAALARYTEALRHEVRPLGIWVSLVEPGAFETNILAAAATSDATSEDYDAVRHAARHTLETSMRKGANASQVADVIGRIASARTPRPRYPVGAEAAALPYLRALLPQRLFEYLLRRAFRLR